MMSIILTTHAKGAYPFDQTRLDSFFDAAVEHGWAVGQIVPFGEPLQWYRIDRMERPICKKGHEIERGRIVLRPPTIQ